MLGFMISLLNIFSYFIPYDVSLVNSSIIFSNLLFSPLLSVFQSLFHLLNFSFQPIRFLISKLASHSAFDLLDLLYFHFSYIFLKIM